MTDKELLNLERIIIDDDKTEAIEFIKMIREKIAEEERLKLKSHLDSSDPIKDFTK
ncbi:MAG: hypothetical protein AB1498_13045 [bacterium]